MSLSLQTLRMTERQEIPGTLLIRSFPLASCQQIEPKLYLVVKICIPTRDVRALIYCSKARKFDSERNKHNPSILDVGINLILFLVKNTNAILLSLLCFYFGSCCLVHRPRKFMCTSGYSNKMFPCT